MAVSLNGWMGIGSELILICSRLAFLDTPIFALFSRLSVAQVTEQLHASKILTNVRLNVCQAAYLECAAQ